MSEEHDIFQVRIRYKVCKKMYHEFFLPVHTQYRILQQTFYLLSPCIPYSTNEREGSVVNQHNLQYTFYALQEVTFHLYKINTVS